MKKTMIVILLGAFLLPGIAKAGEWHEKIKLKGDFRHRHELIQEEDKEDRNRWRIRFRLSLSGDIFIDCFCLPLFSEKVKPNPLGHLRLRKLG